MNEFVTHQPGDLFKKQKHAAIAYYLSLNSGILGAQDGKAAYIWGNSEGNSFYFDTNGSGSRQASASRASISYMPNALILPVNYEPIEIDTIKKNFSSFINDIKYIYELAKEGKLLETSWKRLCDSIDSAEKKIESVSDFLKKEVDYLNSYLKNPRKVDDLIYGFVVAVLSNAIDSGLDIAQLLSLAYNYLTGKILMSDAKIKAVFNTARSFKSELNFEQYSLYPDAYYLGKTLGDIFTLYTAVKGLDKGLSSLSNGGSGSVGSIMRAAGTDGMTVMSLAPDMGAVVVGAGSVSVAGEVVSKAVYNMPSDFDKFVEKKEEQLVPDGTTKAGAPGSKAWNEAIKKIKDSKGKGINVETDTQANAERLLDEARPDIKKKDTYTKNPYNDGFEIHPAEPNVGNGLPHIKWKKWSNGKANGANGHIFFRR